MTSNDADESGYPTDDVTGPRSGAANPNHLRYLKSERHGYPALELTPAAATAELRSPRTVRAARSTTDVLARFEIPSGTQQIRRMR